MHECRLIYPYFDNPQMLSRQVDCWNSYDGELRDRVKVILVDDCSLNHPAYPIFERCTLNKALYRVSQRLPWNMHQARNIGAREACAAGEDPWLFMSDMDIVLIPEMARRLLSKDLNPKHHYSFERRFAPDFKRRKVHNNTFLVKHAAYWDLNGYDLDLTAPYGGGYGGGDDQFVAELNRRYPRQHLTDVVLVGYGRQQIDGAPVIADADTHSLDRQAWVKPFLEALERKRGRGWDSTNPIRESYETLI